VPYDVDKLREQFPALAEGAAHFDGPGGSQVPGAVGDAVAATLSAAMSNRGRSTPSERRSDDTVGAARQAVAALLGGDPDGVVFGRSMTQLTYDFSRTLAKKWSVGDEVVVSRLDHDANVRPWVQAAEAVGAVVRWIDFDPQTTELTPADVAPILSSRSRLVALTGASNLIGTRPDVTRIAAVVHAAGALLYVDGVHLTPHAPIDMTALGADFYVCSPYKFLGPHCGVLAAAPALLGTMHPDKLLPSTDEVPERFELGTLPYELLAGTTAAIDFLAAIAPGPATSPRDRLVNSMTAVEAYEDQMRGQVEARLAALPRVVLYGHAAVRTPTLLFSITDMSPQAVTAALAGQRINAPSGNFYAIEPSRRLGLGDAGAVRIGIAPYTDQSDVDRLITAVEKLAAS
jgi:cysteine desulfurase family protein (TIGR01976 family)